MRRQITTSNTFIIVDDEKYFTFSKQIDMKVVQHMMTSIRTKLRKIEDKGPFFIL
jgi:hypothetical protein